LGNLEEMARVLDNIEKMLVDIYYYYHYYYFQAKQQGCWGMSRRCRWVLSNVKNVPRKCWGLLGSVRKMSMDVEEIILFLW
jgi:hypothetical protein